MRKRRKATETTAAPTTEATTAAPTTTAQQLLLTLLLRRLKFHLKILNVSDPEVRVINVPKDWVEFKAANGGDQYQYAALDGYNIVTLNVFTMDKYQPVEGETWGAEMIANRLYGTCPKNP